MLKLHTNGYYALIRNESTSLCAKRLRRAIITELHAQGLTQRQVAEVFGIHETRVHQIIKSDPPVEPLFGSGEWTPAVQDQDPRTCGRCGGDDGVIQRGSKLYCAACHRTGNERRLKEQRTVTEIAEQYAEVETEYQAVASRKTLAQRRKIKRA